MDTTLGILPFGGGSCANRKWLDEVKTGIVSDTLLLGAAVSSVQRWYGLLSNHLWA